MIMINVTLFYHRKSEQSQCETKPSLEEYLSKYVRVHAKIMFSMDLLYWPKDVFDTYGDEKIYSMFALGTHPDYRGRGIATILVKETLKVGSGFKFLSFF